MNRPTNGWPIHTSRHTSNHPNYSNQITSKMNDWLENNINATPEEAAIALSQWQQDIQNLIGTSTSGPNINTISLPDFP